jgi:hypothetical protein
MQYMLQVEGFDEPIFIEYLVRRLARMGCSVDCLTNSLAPQVLCCCLKKPISAHSLTPTRQCLPEDSEPSEQDFTQPTQA